MADVHIDEGGAELLDAVEPLWLALRDHHAAIAPELGPIRDDEDSWAFRRRMYERWLQEADGRILVARENGSLAGYAFLRTNWREGPSWIGRRRALEVETLSVAPTARGTGVGRALLDRARAIHDAEGYEGLWLVAVAANVGALRFYEREGFTPTFITLRDVGRYPADAPSRDDERTRRPSRDD
jgi:ribosomal protein S18 acetylase RimI-like enzyme